MAMESNLDKADFGSIYNQVDPRAYYRTLGAYDYRIPEHGAEIFRQLLSQRGQAATVLDVCCSYGILAGLMKTTLTLDEVYQHYRDPAHDSLDSELFAETDAKFFATHRRTDHPKMIGLDIADHAIEYAVEAHLLDAGFVENLEQDAPSNQLAESMADVDFIVTTGGIGYVTEESFSHLLAMAPADVTVASFCLRAYDYAPIQRALAQHGLHTEQATQTFRQRKFVDADEQDWSVSQVREWGLDPAGFEDDGYYHANFYLSRTPDAVRDRPAAQIFPELFA